MNQQQRNYAAGRLQVVRKEKQEQLIAHLTKPVMPFKDHLSLDERLVHIKHGSVVLRADAGSRCGRYNDDIHLLDAFDFDQLNAKREREHAAAQIVHKESSKVYKKEVDNIHARIDQAFTASMDELMLGDAETAVRLIAEFGKLV